MEVEYEINSEIGIYFRVTIGSTVAEQLVSNDQVQHFYRGNYQYAVNHVIANTAKYHQIKETEILITEKTGLGQELQLNGG